MMDDQDTIKDDFLQIMTTAPAKFTYSSYPRTVHYKSYRETNKQTTNEKRSYGNVMYDKRVVRGNTWAMKRGKETSSSLDQKVKIDAQKMAEKNKEIRRRIERQRKTGDKLSGGTSSTTRENLQEATPKFLDDNINKVGLISENLASDRHSKENEKNLYIENAQLKRSIDELEVNRVSLKLLNEQLIPKSLENLEKLKKIPRRSNKMQSTQTDSINFMEENLCGDVEKNSRSKIDSDIVKDFIPYIFNQVQTEVNKRILSKVLFDAISFQNTYCRTKSKEHLIELVNGIL
uniref:DUF4806 domain-containing protein n=1 Tax=Romanomermis culicivorax TaxID=13658 RepID=A0A915K8I4_ROMCU